MAKTAILIDGGFYRKRARYLWGEKTAEERAKELEAYCKMHLRSKDGGVQRQLYRIFTTIVRRLGGEVYTIH